MRLSSPAKINLHLRIGPPGADKFHPLLSWMCTVGLADTLQFLATDAPDILLTCNQQDIPVDKSNLIVRAAVALQAAGKISRGARIHLVKNIPMGGGLGGGSSNAAFTLLGLNQLWGLELSMARLAKIGAQLGSDVPFFFHGSSSICTGRGQYVVPIARPRAKFVVLIFPEISIPTPDVYHRFDEMNLGSVSAIDQEPDWTRWTRLKADDMLPLLINDLEAPAFSLHPELGKLCEKTEQELKNIVRMSGSGSTLFTLTDEKPQAQEAVQRLAAMKVKSAVYELSPQMPH